MPGRAFPAAIPAALLLMLLTFAVYWPAMHGDFVWDDAMYVVDNHTLDSAAGLKHIWFSPRSTPQYYPLVFTTFWLEHQLWGEDTFGYHVVNVLLHGLAAVLAWLVLRRLELPGAWVAAALFALHPLQVESVAWISERKNVLSGVCYLAAMLLYLRFARVGAAESETAVGDAADQQPQGRNWAWYILSEVLFVAALLAKTVTATLPAALLLILWWKRRLNVRDVLYLLPFFAWAISLSLVTAYLERTGVGAAGPEWDLSFAERLIIAGRAVWFYVGKLFWPYPLSFMYERWQIDASSLLQYLYPLSALAVVAVLVLLVKKLGRGPLTAVLFFGGTLLPALGFVNFYPMRFSFVADHFQYLACLGLISLVVGTAALGLKKLAGSSRAVQVVPAAVVLATLAVLSWRQAGVYESSLTLWKQAVAAAPASWAAHNNLGKAYADAGRFDEAREAFAQAISLAAAAGQPVSEAYVNQGKLLLRRGRYPEAMELFGQAYKINEFDPEANFRIGLHLVRYGKLQPGIAHLERSRQVRPRDADTLTALAMAYSDASQQQRAKETFRAALEVNPQHYQANLQGGLWFGEQGNLQAAEHHIRKALEVEPSAVQARLSLAEVYLRFGQPQQAVEEYRRAIEQDPSSPAPKLSLARILATHPSDAIRDGAEAVQLATAANQATGDKHPVYLDTLAAAYAEQGDFEQAQQTAQRAYEAARAKIDDTLAAQIQQRIEGYKRGEPYRLNVGPGE